MSPTGPRPADIPFDHAAAARAQAALQRATAVLHDVGAGRTRASAVAREDFLGVSAEDFATADQEIGRASGDARRAVATLCSDIALAAEAARTAQAARAVEQQEWDAARAHPAPVGVR